jgi:rhodanese-related sulfurtransferase
MAAMATQICRMRFLSPQEVVEIKPLLLDVRTAKEYRSVHIPQSVSLPLQDLKPDALPEAVHASPVVCLVCQSGTRARHAAQQLEAVLGTRLSLLEGGLQAWQQAGLEIRKGQSTLPVDRQVRIIVGLMILTGVGLSLTLHPGYIGIAAFAGFGLLVAGITDWCPLALLVARMPWNRA